MQQRFKQRLTNEIAKAHGYNGYVCLSFLELENAVDERPIFENLNRQIIEGAM